MDYKDCNDYELLYMVKENEEALEVIINKYNPIIVHICYMYRTKYKNYSIDLEDLIQEGRIALIKACDSFSDTKNVMFYTYAILCIKRRIYNFISCNYLRNRDIPLYNYESLEETNLQFSDYKHPLDDAINYEVISTIKSFSLDLDFMDSCVFNLKYNGFSNKEVASLLDISLKDVDNRMYKIYKKLKKYLLGLNFCL